jgi:hypothetical protein
MGKVKKMDIVLKDVTFIECAKIHSLLNENKCRIQRKRKTDWYEIQDHDVYLKFEKIFWKYYKEIEEMGFNKHQKVKNVSNKIPVSKKVIL